MSENQTLVGKALYLEFRKGVSTYQIIIAPESATGAVITKPKVWSRQVSAATPRKQWTDSFANPAEQDLRKLPDATGKFEQQNIDEARIIGLNNIYEVRWALDNLSKRDWELYKQPIVVEYSLEDKNAANDWKTPAALLRRIQRARLELGFPESYFAEPTPAPAV